jgi:hypothetical protein
MNDEGPALTMSGGLGRVELWVLHQSCRIMPAMRLVPVDHVAIESAWSAQDLSQRLAASVGRPARWWPFWRRDKLPFEGSVEGQHFAVLPSARLDRDFAIELYIQGDVVARGSGSVLEAVIRPHRIFSAFAVVWVLGTLALTGLMIAYPSSGRVKAGDYVPLFMLAVGGYSVFLSLFRRASRRAQEMLSDIAR